MVKKIGFKPLKIKTFSNPSLGVTVINGLVIITRVKKVLME